MEITEVLYPAASALLSATITWVFSRRRQKAEARAGELDNVEKAITIWRTMSEELSQQVAELKKEILSLETKVDALMQENITLKTELKKHINNN